MERLDVYRGSEIALEELVNSITSELYENVNDADIDIARTAGRRKERQQLYNVIGWAAFFPISLIRYLVKIRRKKVQIKKIIAREDDPVKKEKLKHQLRDLNSKQVKITNKISKVKDQAKKKAAKDDSVDRVRQEKATKALRDAMAELEEM